MSTGIRSAVKLSVWALVVVSIASCGGGSSSDTGSEMSDIPPSTTSIIPSTIPTLSPTPVPTDALTEDESMSSDWDEGQWDTMSWQ